jgi:hypothetical protein
VRLTFSFLPNGYHRPGASPPFFVQIKQTFSRPCAFNFSQMDIIAQARIQLFFNQANFFSPKRDQLF